MKIKEKFYGDRLRLIRMYRGWSMSDCAKKFGCSKQAISKYEEGLMKPNYVLMIGMCAICEIPNDFFIRERLHFEIIKDRIFCKELGLIKNFIGKR